MIDDSYAFLPSVLLVTDGPDAERRAAIAARAAGCRVRAETAVDDAVRWLNDEVPVDAVVVDLAEPQGERLGALVDCIVRMRRRQGIAGIVSVPMALVDSLAAAALDGTIMLLADAALDDLAIGVATALAEARAGPRLHERDPEPARLRQLSEEVGRIARTLAELSGVREPRSDFRTAPVLHFADEPGPEISAAMVRATIRSRRLRDQFFDAGLFADPAWDMLLDLMAARLEGRQVAVSSLCIAAAVPATTALRWIKTLADEGLVVRFADPRDGRRVFIELSETAAGAVRAYFNALGRAGIAPA